MNGMKADPLHAEAAIDDPPAPSGILDRLKRFNDENLSTLEFSINPERIAPLLRRLVTPTKTRARIFDREGALLLDSRTLYSRGDILRFDLPPLQKEQASFFERAWTWV